MFSGYALYVYLMTRAAYGAAQQPVPWWLRPAVAGAVVSLSTGVSCVVKNTPVLCILYQRSTCGAGSLAVVILAAFVFPVFYIVIGREDSVRCDFRSPALSSTVHPPHDRAFRTLCGGVFGAAAVLHLLPGRPLRGRSRTGGACSHSLPRRSRALVGTQRMCRAARRCPSMCPRCYCNARTARWRRNWPPLDCPPPSCAASPPCRRLRPRWRQSRCRRPRRHRPARRRRRRRCIRRAAAARAAVRRRWRAPRWTNCAPRSGC